MGSPEETYEDMDLEPCICGGRKFNVWETSLVAVVDVEVDDGDGVVRNYATLAGPDYPQREVRCVQCGKKVGEDSTH